MDTIQTAIATIRRQLGSICRGWLMSDRGSFLADPRGAVSFEVILASSFLIFGMLLPLTDLGIAGFQYISAWEALRAFGQSIQYNTPPDVTNSSSWQSTAIAKADSHFPISNFQLLCGDSKASCSAGNVNTATGAPTVKYYSYTTSVTFTPKVLTSVLCKSGNANPCTYTLPYSERFQ